MEIKRFIEGSKRVVKNLATVSGDITGINPALNVIRESPRNAPRMRVLRAAFMAGTVRATLPATEALVMDEEGPKQLGFQIRSAMPAIEGITMCVPLAFVCRATAEAPSRIVPVALAALGVKLAYNGFIRAKFDLWGKPGGDQVLIEGLERKYGPRRQ